MKFIFCPDSFKGTLNSETIIQKLETSAKKYFQQCDIVKVPIADGGEGTIEALLSSCGGERISMNVVGPENTMLDSYYAVMNGNTAVIEMAQTSGLTLLKKDKNPLYTTSYGMGQLMNHAIESGYREICVSIGGSATNDGGMGAMMALGAVFYNQKKEIIKDGIGLELQNISSIDITNMNPGIKDCSIKVLCDVNNPLLGPLGATHVYGPQKGAAGQILDTLENGMENYAAVMKKDLQKDMIHVPGAGAAGGMGAALMAFLDAELSPGIHIVLDLVHFEELLKDADLVITGEGNIDEQSSYGKVLAGIGRLCKKMNVPAIAIGGGVGAGAEKLYDMGILSFMPVISSAMTIEEALKHSDEMFDKAADRMFGMLNVGMRL